jgi:hypothetical protein
MSRSAHRRATAHYLQFFLIQRSQWPIRSWGSPDACRPGPVGLCWSNARSVVADEPDRLAYVEGTVNREGWEQHAWAIDKATGAVEEVTSGYEESTRYRGLVLDLPKVEAWLGPERRARWSDPAPSAVWIALYEFYEGRMKTAELNRTLRHLLAKR